ncbi:hypothetical protein FXF51_26030 [Nonomuraea sp. PA05]|uniref:hypothetical protein n=1 Tax=Nonomuraea sp. PA05 TaxID=2604466 RepID=UPI0011DB1B45|nr:hypothetical protein [Nonomuraea sp. PA05]TYB62183.1 hypothetical protein FXF51_26030 [Nonomuraea sp. PA05]
MDPAAVEEVRDIGTVFTRTMADPIYDNTIQVEDILIMDVGGSGVDEALDIARGRLAQRGWTVVGTSERLLVMESAKWKGTTLQAAGVERFDSYGADREAEILAAAASRSGQGGQISGVEPVARGVTQGGRDRLIQPPGYRHRPPLCEGFAWRTRSGLPGTGARTAG